MATRGHQDDAQAGALAAIGAAIDGAQDAPIFAEMGDIRPFGHVDDDEDGDDVVLPPGCPVVCLGKNDQTCFYLDYNGQIISLPMGTGHGKNAMVGLFGRKIGWLEKQQAFAQWSKPVREREEGTNKWVIVEESRIIGFDQAKASRALIIECTRKGIFDPAGRVRGSGAHRVGKDGLVLHCGADVLLSRVKLDGRAEEPQWFKPGLHGDYVYTAAAAIPQPWPETVPEHAGERMLHLIKQWHWKRPALDPLLILGGIGSALIGGALDWRSNIWVTGGSGTGKSTFNGEHGVLDLVFGKGRVTSAETSAAYLRQRLRNSTLPVFLDELEASQDERRSQQILELARVSSSGATAGRGGQDHQAVEFTLRSSFWASSILIPPMKPQDRSRWAVCQLMPIPAGAKKPDLRAQRLPELGRQLLRRMIDGWYRWEDTLARYVDALQALGHTARGCMQFGTLLAAADILRYDAPSDDETVRINAGLCGADLLREVSESAAEHELCINHLRTSMVQSRGGDERESLGSWIGAAVQELVEPEGLYGSTDKMHRRLQEIGLKLVSRSEKGVVCWKPRERAYLAVANGHQGLSAIFGQTDWKNGVWAQALGYAPGAIGGMTTKFRSASMRATLVPLELVIDESEVPQPARWARDGAVG